MPRAFDRGVPPLDKNPLQSATSWDDPQGIIGEAANIYGEFLKQWVTTLLEDGLANVFKDCTDGFIEGLRQLGTGETDLAKIGDGLNSFIDTLVATLLCKVEGAVTPQDLLSTVGNIFDLLGASPIIQQLQALVESSGSGLQDALGGIIVVLESLLGSFTIEGFLMPLLTWIRWVWEQFGATSETFLKPVLTLIKTIWDAFTTAATAAGSNASVWLGDLFGFLGWIWQNFGAAVDTFLKPVATLIKTIWDTFAAAAVGTGQTATSLLTGLFAFLSWLWNGAAGGFAGFRTTVETVLKPLIEFLDWVWSLFSTTASGSMDSLKGIFTALANVVNANGSLGEWISSLGDDLLEVIGTLTGGAVTSITQGLSELTRFTQSLPNIGSLISGLMGSKVNPATGTNNTLPDLIWWASQLLLSTSVIPSFNLTGAIPPELLALIGVGNVGNVAPNLITDAGFGSAAALQAGVGWTWDSTVNSTGSTGGSAKLLCDGGVKYMFSNLIAAAPGQQLTVSVKTKYTKSISAQATIIAAVRTYNGATVKSTDTVASLTTTGTTSVGTSGADAAGFKTITGTYTVPAGVDTVRLVLGVTTGTSGTTVWFDDASLAKTSLLPQDLVHNLGNTLQSLLPADEFTNLLNGVASTTGATVQQVLDVINGKLTSSSPLNGTNITAGNISAEFIAELKETWEKLGGSVQGATGTPPTTIGGLVTEFASLVGNITSLSSLIGGNTRDIFNLASIVNGQQALVGGIDGKLQAYSKDISDKIKPLSDQDILTAQELVKIQSRLTKLETATSTPPPTGTNQPVVVPPPVVAPPPTTPTAPPPTPVSVVDDFERSSLGSAWTVTQFNTNGATLGILNAHDAYMATPTVSQFENRIAAIYNGAAKASIGEYQQIYATLGSKAGIPLLGTQGFNDLIGRAVSATQCLFCRFYPDGRVQFGYRSGNWTDIIIGQFQLANGQQLTSGSRIEFLVGDKTVSDQTKLYAKVGTAIVGPSYVSAGTLATMGKGWGFAMGHGLSAGNFTFGFGNPQGPGTLNFWAAQEQ